MRSLRHLAWTRVAASIVPAVLAVTLLSSCGAATRSRTTLKLKPATRPARTGTRVEAAIPPGPGALVAIVMRATALRASPGGRPMAKLTARTEFGGPDYMWAVAHRNGWLAVISPLVGNGHTGWISQYATRFERNPWELKVSLSARQLTVLRDKRVVQHSTVAIGPPESPTPVGRFAVTDRLTTPNPNGPYGCCILALSAHSPHTIQGWSGGDRIAIHSTPDTASIGEAVSHGCVRVTMAEGRWLLNHIPLATPTIISN